MAPGSIGSIDGKPKVPKVAAAEAGSDRGSARAACCRGEHAAISNMMHFNFKSVTSSFFTVSIRDCIPQEMYESPGLPKVLLV